MKIVDIRTVKHTGLKYRTKTRIYISLEDETILEHFRSGRFTRPHQVYREEIIPKLIAQGYITQDSKLRWSQKAGCSSCPCSPGFITDQILGHDIYIRVSIDKSQPCCGTSIDEEPGCPECNSLLNKQFSKCCI